MIAAVVRVLIGGGLAVAILGAVQGVSGRQFWSSARFGQPASRRAGLITAVVGVAAVIAGALIQRASS